MGSKRADVARWAFTPDQVIELTGLSSRQLRYCLRNAPVVAGTRIPTKLIWDMRQDGASVQQVLNAYPTLTRKDVAAAEEYERERRKAG
jgi:hypothetical protein